MAERKVLNRNVMIDLIGDDRESIRQFEIDFLKQAKTSLIKIAALYNEKNLAAIKEEAHFLKTSAKAVGAEQTADLLEALEHSAVENNKEKSKQKIIQIKESLLLVHKEVKNG
ncbi:Hpt domain-containing protein [Psychromonas aquimarina]|uniref:Hpt domain-containing protein n=1 Tax=Psychromonas aquimarina TaxID=444919 RepID=UPI000427DEAC|nr:Hpt domain-containing protein [Psychromonas aquimarina]